MTVTGSYIDIVYIFSCYIGLINLTDFICRANWLKYINKMHNLCTITVIHFSVRDKVQQIKTWQGDQDEAKQIYLLFKVRHKFKQNKHVNGFSKHANESVKATALKMVDTLISTGADYCKIHPITVFFQLLGHISQYFSNNHTCCC